MIVLAVNTAFPACNIAIASEGVVLVDTFEPMMRGQDAQLAGLVEEALNKAGLKLSDLARIAVITGPGSFTGVRVGVAFARGLALVLGVPCVGLTSLEASVPLAMQEDVLATLPAQKRPPDLTYWAQHIRSGIGAGPPDELSSEVLEQHVGALGVANFKLGEPQDMAAVAALKAVSLAPEKHPPVPVYVREPDAVPMPPR